MNAPKYTIITGNPVDGFELYGIFDTEYEAISHADGDSHISDSWHIMRIDPLD